MFYLTSNTLKSFPFSTFSWSLKAAKIGGTAPYYSLLLKQTALGYSSCLYKLTALSALDYSTWKMVNLREDEKFNLHALI